jgi:hypothetical protein
MTEEHMARTNQAPSDTFKAAFLSDIILPAVVAAKAAYAESFAARGDRDSSGFVWVVIPKNRKHRLLIEMLELAGIGTHNGREYIVAPSAYIAHPAQAMCNLEAASRAFMAPLQNYEFDVRLHSMMD